MRQKTLEQKAASLVLKLKKVVFKFLLELKIENVPGRVNHWSVCAENGLQSSKLKLRKPQNKPIPNFSANFEAKNIFSSFVLNR